MQEIIDSRLTSLTVLNIKLKYVKTVQNVERKEIIISGH